jgi:hypothetical protein
MTRGGSGPLVMNGPLSALAAAPDDQRASSTINSPGVDCRNFPSFEAEIAGGFECALKIGEMLAPVDAITATGLRANSIAIAGNRSYSPSAKRYSMVTFWPST